jgi:hypothetical protein
MKKEKIKHCSDRENYIKNRDNLIDEFNEWLSGDIDFREVALKAIFRTIRQQEEFIIFSLENKISYVDIKEEKEIHKKMIKDVKIIFKKDYNDLYEQFNKRTI